MFVCSFLSHSFLFTNPKTRKQYQKLKTLNKKQITRAKTLVLPLAPHLSFSMVHIRSECKVSDTNHGRVLVCMVTDVASADSIRKVRKQRSLTSSNPALSNTNTGGKEEGHLGRNLINKSH